MGHKKTEYLRNYKSISPTSIKKIYEENIHYRNKRKLIENSHHPFDWDDSDSCSDCSNNNLSAIISTKSKHKCKELIENWLRNQNSLAARDLNKTAEIGVQTPNWKNGSSEDHSDKSIQFGPPIPMERFEPPNSSSKLELPSAILTSTSVKTAHYPNEKRLLFHESSKCDNRMNGKRKDTKPPFHSYGWADENSLIAEKKSFNVYGSNQKVDANTAKRKQPAPKKVLNKKNKPESTPRECIWQSEYQKSFGHK